jgi:UDP-N-acetylglucosamine diphosphorylase/glucosamine-1-phosphate N-acetyltransferase
MFILVLNEDNLTESFYPLTFTRDLVDLKAGIFTIKEKWERMALDQKIELTILIKTDGSQLGSRSIPANFIPPATLNLKTFFKEDKSLEELGFKKVNHLWDILSLNSWLIENDLLLIKDQQSDKSNARIYGTHPVVTGSNVIIEHCTINTTDGPVFIDDHAHIMDGVMLRGPLSIGKYTVVKMGSTIYGGTVIGPHCIIGGEIKNTTIQGYTNKAHHGYLGNSYIGEWCNLGAGTSGSNLKNTLGEIGVWDIANSNFANAGKKAGVFMGDHVKTAINTSFNSGTVIGPCANIFEFEGLTSKYIDSFSWGGRSEAKYEIEKLVIEIKRWMELKNYSLSSDNEEKIRTLYFKMK